MASNAYGAKRILCPFFRRQDAQTIGCECPFDGAKLVLRFDSMTERKKQSGIFCEDQFRRCEIYRCIMQNRYPERDE